MITTVNHRQGAITNLQKHAQKMMKYSNTKLTELQLGTIVRVIIPDVDRACGSSLNLWRSLLHMKLICKNYVSTIKMNC